MPITDIILYANWLGLDDEKDFVQMMRHIDLLYMNEQIEFQKQQPKTGTK